MNFNEHSLKLSLILSFILVLILSCNVIIDKKTVGDTSNQFNRLDGEGRSSESNFHEDSLILFNNKKSVAQKIVNDEFSSVLLQNHSEVQKIQNQDFSLKNRLESADDINEDVAFSITTDQSINILVTGSIYQEETGSDVYLSKFLNNGTWLWSKYLIGNEKDYGTDVVVDNQANIIVVGQTTSNDFPTTEGAIKGSRLLNDYDVFVTKFSSIGSMLWSTYLGGGSWDIGICSVDIDSQDNIIVAGRTESLDFNTTEDAMNSTYNGGFSDLFIVKINSTGSLLWSTYLGGSNQDYGLFGITDYLDPNEIDVVIDNDDNVIVTSSTLSEDFPTKNAYQSEHAGSFSVDIGGDLCLSKFSSSGSLMWSTFLGGSHDEFGHSVIVDSFNNIIITGKTISSDFPTENAYQSDNNGGNGDLCLSKFSPSGELQWSTYFGGNKEDRGHSVAIDNLNNVLVIGWTQSKDFPIVNAYQENYNGGVAWGDAFLSKFSSNGVLVWSTYLGGLDDDDGVEVAVDYQNNIIVSGNTKSSDFPTLNAYKYSFGGEFDGFLSKFNSSGGLVWSTRALVVTEPNSDPDDDGLTNLEEFQFNSGLDPRDNDTDDDRMKDGDEVNLGLDPLKDDAYDDKDGDGLPNIIEYWSNGKLDMNNNDTDGDGMPDGWEVKMFLDPTTDDAQEDEDEDGIPNLWEFQNKLNANNFNDSTDDPDSDDLSNFEEYNYSLQYTDIGYEDDLDPHNPDTDSDGMPDGWEVRHKLDPLNPDDANQDLDGDGIPNKLEYQLGFNPESSLELFAGFFLIFILLCLIAGFFLRTRKLNQEAVILGFENNADKKAAFKAGFKSIQERSEAKTGGFMTAEIYNIVKAAGWFNVEEMVADWENEFSAIRAELTDEVIQEAIQLLLESSSPIHLNQIETELKPLFSNIEKNNKRVIQIASLQESLTTHLQTSKTPPLIGLTQDELSTHKEQSASLLQFLTECENKINDKITDQRELFAPWPQLLTLIQLTEDRSPVKLSEIAKVVNCSEEQAEHLIILLLKEDESIGNYDEKEKVYTKGHDVSVLIQSYIKEVRKVIKDFEK